MFLVSVWCKLLASQVLFKGSNLMEIIGLHSANRTCDWLQHNGWYVVNQVLYIHSVVCSGFHLFGPRMKSTDGKQFATNADTKPTFATWLQTLGSDFLYADIQP